MDSRLLDSRYRSDPETGLFEVRGITFFLDAGRLLK
jgi:hypothetical protein